VANWERARLAGASRFTSGSRKAWYSLSQSLTKPGPQPRDTPPSAAQSDVSHWFRRDRLLLGATALCGLIISYQLGVTVAKPIWSGLVTDWLRAALSWPELLLVVYVSIRLTRARWPGALSWWMFSAALLSYAIARNLWTVDDQLIFHHGVPFPTFPDLFFVLQYPFFFLAVVFWPHGREWGPRLIIILDGVILMGAATALSWYFILLPVYAKSGLTPLARTVSLAYPVVDLFVIFALTMTLLRPRRTQGDRLVLGVLVMAVICLIAADAWVGWLLLYSAHIYTTGNPPDLFWLAFYLLVPLASLIQLRLIQRKPLWNREVAVARINRESIQRRDLMVSLRFIFPFVAALLTTTAILIRATMTVVYLGWRSLIAPYAVCFGLLLLVVIRQELVFLQNAQLRHERELARASDLAQREIIRRKDEFLSVVGHELKTPLTCLQGYTELLARHFTTWRPQEGEAKDLARKVTLARTAIEHSRDSVRRIAGLVDHMLDDARARDSHLLLLVEPCDLSAIVSQAVVEHRLLASGRTIRLELPASRPVPVIADAMRIGQVVNNYLSNALKYSKEDLPVAVRLEAVGDWARVSVRDEGIGIPILEQAHVWERFHRIEGTKVQSGSSVGLGVGMYISKSIIERHSGQVGVQSSPGHGSTFWFTLPIAAPPLNTPPRDE
jgi:signal transduction histidine kinase